MLKKVSALLLVLVFSTGLMAQAAGPSKAPTRNLSLSFDETTAICTASVQADKATDSVSAELKLWRGGTVLKTWKKSGTLVVRFNETASVVKGADYKLTLDSTVNGVKQPQQSKTATCPK